MDIQFFVTYITDLLFKLGYFGVFVGTFLESFFVPIPSELLMGAAGFLISNGSFAWLPTILFAVSGTSASSAIVWWIGRNYGENFVLKYGKYVGYDEEELRQAERLFNRWGYPVIFACQMVPVMRSVVTVPAGVLKTKFVPFIIATTAGATIWLTGLTYVGVQLGKNWPDVLRLAKPYETPILISIALFLAFYVYHHFYNAHKRSKAKSV